MHTFNPRAQGGRGRWISASSKPALVYSQVAEWWPPHTYNLRCLGALQGQPRLRWKTLPQNKTESRITLSVKRACVAHSKPWFSQEKSKTWMKLLTQDDSNANCSCRPLQSQQLSLFYKLPSQRPSNPTPATAPPTYFAGVLGNVRSHIG